MRDPVETVPPALPCQESPDRGRTHLEEQSPGLLIDAEMSMHREVLHEEGHASCQTDRTQERAGTPDRDRCLLHRRAISGRDALYRCTCLAGSAKRTQSPRRER